VRRESAPDGGASHDHGQVDWLHDTSASLQLEALDRYRAVVDVTDAILIGALELSPEMATAVTRLAQAAEVRVYAGATA
jgi:hypothetical protein